MYDEKTQKLHDEAQRHLKSARDEMDKITDDTPDSEVKEIEARHDQHIEDYNKAEAKLKRYIEMQKAEKRMQDIDKVDELPKPPDTDTIDQVIDEMDVRSEAYKDEFEYYVRTKDEGRLKSFRGAYQSQADIPEPESLKKAREERAAGDPLSTGTNVTGGFLIPEGFMSKIIEHMKAYGPMYTTDKCMEIMTSMGNDIPWPTVDDTGEEGEDHAESAAMAGDDPAGMFGREVLKAYVRDSKMIKVPIELLQDTGVPLEPLLARLIGVRLGRGANKFLTIGTGTNQAEGIVTGSSLGVTTAASHAPTADEFIDLEHSVDPAYRASPGCCSMFSDNTLKYVRKLKDGNGNYLWQGADLRMGAPPTFLGYGYLINQHMPEITLDNGKAVVFGDFSYYVRRIVRGIILRRLDELYAANLQIGLFAWHRFDGRVLNENAIKHMKIKA